jgi:superfamily II DNA or RNA helicase
MFLYIYKHTVNIIKFGIYKNKDNYSRIRDGQTYSANKIYALYIFEIIETNNYKLSYKEYDKIISILGRNSINIKKVESVFNIKLNKLLEINKYLITEGGTELITLNGLYTLLKIIKIDFPLLGLNIRQFTDEELQDLNHKLDTYWMNKEKEKQEYDNKLFDNWINEINLYKENNLLILSEIITPHEHQLYVLWNSLYTFLRDKKGLLLWSCGLGKTIMAFLICCKYQFKNIIIGLPSKNLLLQWNNEIKKHLGLIPILCYGESDNKHLLNTINKQNINIVLTTYHSSNKIVKLCKNKTYKFDIKIGDEAHHLVTNKKDADKNTFDKFHLIPSEYSLFMTATEKNIDNMNSISGYNMYDKLIYGDIIDSKSIKWAIENKKITDYNIICIYNNDIELETLMSKINLEALCSKDYSFNKKELFMSAYFSLKSLNDNLVSHILIYANKCQSALIIRKIIDILIKMNIFTNINKSILDNESNFYNKEIYSNNEIYHNIKNIKFCNYCKNTNLKDYKCEYKKHLTKENCNTDKLNCKIKCNKYNQEKIPIFHNENENIECELCRFKKAKYGIISCVYIFGEGFDLPKLNGVVIGETMSSDIRIIQSCLRPNRLDKTNPDKKAYIIIPVNLNNIEDVNSNNKLIRVIKELGTSDEILEQKIKLVDIKECKKSLTYIEDKKLKIRNNKRLLSKLIMNLYSRNCFSNLGLTLEKEYEFYKQMYSDKYKLVKDYKNDTENKIKNPDIYFSKYWKGWFDYLGIDTSSWIPELYKWKEYCQEKNIKSIDDYKCLVNIDDKLPPEPEYFYCGFDSFNKELSLLNNDVYIF